MFAWGYRMYGAYSIYNGKTTLMEDPFKVASWGIFFIYDGYKAWDQCLDERDDS